MQAILLVLGGLRWTLDLIIFVLDLNYWLVSALISILVWTLYSVFSLPETITFTLQHCWECMLLRLAIFGECCCDFVIGAMQVTGGILKGFLTGFDILQLAWNVSFHMVIWCNEAIQHCLLRIALSGQILHQQISEALTLAGSLADHIFNHFVNMSLLIVENTASAAFFPWHSLLTMIYTSKDFVVLLISQFSTTVVAVAIILWAPFQITVDILVSYSTAMGIILLKYLYVILLLLTLIGISCVLTPSPALHFFCEKLNRVYHTVLILLRLMLNSNMWRSVVELLRMYRAAWDRDINQRRSRQNTSFRITEAQNLVEPTPQNSNAAERQLNVSGLPTLRENSVATRVSHEGASTFREDPWKLLRQQEEGRKCVICQEETKTVLLLPCRHLCLCGRCTQILLQQPILQRNCPLCRQMILQTLNVYM
ncbi:E3 ubiquitin-protein ligase RNF26 [Gastrophryne carolinensis]